MGLSAVEICAGAGGQALGLELAGFDHEIAVELDANAARTLLHNRSHWKVEVGDVASADVWDPGDFRGVDLFAGGVPCPPFSIAGQQRGADDERDLFAWAVATAEIVKPRAILLENVRGLSTSRFSGYRQRIADELARMGYWSDWRLVHAADFGVPQLRPRYVLVALDMDAAQYFDWPTPTGCRTGIGPLIGDLLGAGGWAGARRWSTEQAGAIAPTIVGGSKKHGGADLGPTRAKAAWSRLGIDAHGVADGPPSADLPADYRPRLTTEMVARIQGWLPPVSTEDEYRWDFTGAKTSRYRQIGNAFPPPVARAVGGALASALRHEGAVLRDPEREASRTHDPVLRVLQASDRALSLVQIARRSGMEVAQVSEHIGNLQRDFEIVIDVSARRPRFLLDRFRGFVGQPDHQRHDAFENRISSIS